MKIHAAVVASGLALCGGLASGEVYTLSGVSGFIQDLDSADGFNALTGLVGTWTLEFEVPGQSGLTLLGNTQSQGGSRTAYSGVTLNSLVLDTASGRYDLVTESSAGTISLWDRADFRGGQESVSLSFDVAGSSSIEIDFDAIADLGDLALGQLFNIGTPGPNTLDSDFLPLFGDAGEANALYSSPGITIEAFSPDFPGRARFFGDSEVFALVPAPGGVAALGAAGLLATRRRR